MQLPNFDFLKFNEESRVPIPTTDHLKKIAPLKPKTLTALKPQKPLVKYEREYDAYCRWKALPEELRKPKSVMAFEKKWKIPDSYSAKFQERDDFRDRVLKYFWDWLMDMFPNVVYAAYKKIKDNGSHHHIKILAYLISKHMDIDKPAQVIQPFMIMGVNQDKIDALFQPKGFSSPEDIETILPDNIK